MYKRFCFLTASFLGLGYSKFAPGTIGSLATLPLVFLCGYYFGVAGILALASVAFVLGVIATKEVLKHSKHDPSFVVIDEVVGQSLTFVLVSQALNVWWVYVLGFVLFRFFDIVKMGPVKWADTKLENAYGVMLDDVFAGLISAVILLAFYKVFGF